jgi:hypothetical protein
MTWLWLLVPIVLLGTAAALWRTTLRLEHQRAELEAQLGTLRADGPDRAHR